jgi:hypothetical protein
MAGTPMAKATAAPSSRDFPTMTIFSLPTA